MGVEFVPNEDRVSPSVPATGFRGATTRALGAAPVRLVTFETEGLVELAVNVSLQACL